MQQWHGKSRGNKSGYRIFVFIIKNLGIYPAYFLLLFVAFYYFLFSPASTKHIYRYFKERHKFSRFKSIRYVYLNYLVFGQTLIDKLIVMSGIENKFTYNMDGKDHLFEIENLQKGGILMSAHIGNWEMASQWFSEITGSINIIMLDAEHQQIKEYIDSISKQRSYHIIPIKDDMSHIYDIGRAFQRHELVCMHADRFLEGNKTEKKIFMGEQAGFPVGPFAIAATFRVPVSFVFAFKESLTHYHFYATEPIILDKEKNRQQIIDQLMNTFISKLEEMVHRYPLQWFNYYNFWKE